MMSINGVFQNFSIKCYLVLLHFLVLLLLFGDHFLSNLKDRLCYTKDKTAFYKQMAVHLQRQDPFIPEKSILFLGDSIIHGLCVSAIDCRSVNLGIGTDTVDGLLGRIKRYQSIQNTHAVFIYIGGNDVGKRDTKWIIERISLIIQQIPRHAPIYFCSILPVDEKRTQQRTNKQIDSLNDELKILCSNFEHVKLLDIAREFKDSSGKLRFDFYEKDGVHLNQQGYAQMIKFFRNYLKENITETRICERSF